MTHSSSSGGRWANVMVPLSKSTEGKVETSRDPIFIFGSRYNGGSIRMKVARGTRDYINNVTLIDIDEE